MYKPTVETKAAPAICHLSTTQRKRRPALIPNLDNFSPADTQDLARSRGIQIPPLVPAACQAMAEKTNVSSMKKPNWRRALLVKTESESPKNDISTRDDEAQVESPRSDRRFLQRLKIPLVSSRGNHNGTREQESVRYDAPQISQLRLGCGRSARRGETRGGRGLSSPDHDTVSTHIDFNGSGTPFKNQSRQYTNQAISPTDTSYDSYFP